MWLETVSVSEEYSLECAEGWDRSTLLQRDELESEVAPILAAWLDRHKLRPKFFVVKYPNEFRRDGKGGAE